MIVVALVLQSATGCNWMRPSNDSPYNHIFREEEAHLTDDVSSPFCDLSIDYTYLEEGNDSIAALINRSIQREWLGDEYATLSPVEAVDSFKNVYIRKYRQETGKMYSVDKSKTTYEEEIPSWYNRTYSLVTFVEEGRAGILNASANYFEDMGGAHPNQWSKWMNLESETGKLLTLEDVFLPTAQKDIEQLLTAHLIQMQAEIYPDESMETLEDLQEKGFLQSTNMYIPHNFLLQKEGILFLFNRYDIAPYSTGEIVIKVSYEEIGPYLHCYTIQ